MSSILYTHVRILHLFPFGHTTRTLKMVNFGEPWFNLLTSGGTPIPPSLGHVTPTDIDQYPPDPPLIWCTRLGCRLNHWGHCSAVDPPQSFSIGGSGSTSRQRGESSGSSSQGGVTVTKKPSRSQKNKAHDKHSSSFRPLPSKPAAAADPFTLLSHTMKPWEWTACRPPGRAPSLMRIPPLLSSLRS
jgi:hypothetical protein